MALTTVSGNRWALATRTLCLLCALLAIGCYKATGGGWIPSVTGADKATFGFSVMCKTARQPNGTTVAVIYDGQLDWKDGDVKLHGSVEPFTSVPGVTCDNLRQVMPTNTIQFQGTYQPHPKGTPGTFTVNATDQGEPGTLNGDSISIEIHTGQYAGYSNQNNIQGGNIQVF